jgi:hypothetical protein
MAVYYADMLFTGFIGAEKGNIPIGGIVAVLARDPVCLIATAGKPRGRAPLSESNQSRTVRNVSVPMARTKSWTLRKRML